MPPRAVDRQRALAVAQAEGLQQPGQTEPVVDVQVGDEDVGQIAEADRAQQLALRALAAVDQDPLRPRRTSSAGSPRRALGTDPAVPANITENSIRGRA